MRAYYFDDLPGDQGLPHDSGVPVSNAALASIGVLLWHVPIPISVASDFVQVDTIALERDYKTIDVMAVTKESLGELYEEKLKIFYSESVFSWPARESRTQRYVLQAYARRRGDSVRPRGRWLL